MGKNSRLWAFSSAKKVLLTAEKVGIGPKLAKITGGAKPGHLEEGEGPKMAKIHYGVKTSRKQGCPKKAKIQYGVKPDIF